MAAIVSGNNLGLSASSLGVMGVNGAFGDAAHGRAGEKVYVDVSNGNLVIQRRDDLLAGHGAGIDTVRTYNSLGGFDGDNDDNWRIGLYRKVYGLTGTVNAAGSTVKRVDGDGAETVFTYHTGRARYENWDGDAAVDFLTLDTASNTWTWTDGASQVKETYDGNNGGRITGSSDLAGNDLLFGYTGSLLTSVTQENGDQTVLVYSGNNLQEIRQEFDDHGLTRILTRVRYSYDELNRLKEVRVDLSPEDNSVADGREFVTRYTYDGVSRRIASVESGAEKLELTYVLDGAAYKVATVKDALGRETRFTHTSSLNRTTVTDPLGVVTTFNYNAANGQLASVVGPAGTRSFYYDTTSGNLNRILDESGRNTYFDYEAATGNLFRQRDHLGNIVRTLTYNAQNLKLTDTFYGTGGAAMTERNVYGTVAGTGAYGKLRYEISAEGRVTEHLYNDFGERSATIRYTFSSYATGAAVPTEAAMQAWIAAGDRSQSLRTDFEYDFRGELARSTMYSKLNAGGTPAADSVNSVTTFVYDQAGHLLATVTPRGNATVMEGDFASTYAYDGLGRVIAVTEGRTTGEVQANVPANVTLTTYDDAGNRTIVKLANDLTTTSFYDRGGQLIKVAQTDAFAALLGETVYDYDANGRLRMTTDPTGARQHCFYDAAGRKMAEIDADGSAIEYVYDAAGNLIKSIAYANRANTASLVDAAGRPAAVAFASVRPAVTVDDRVVRNVYDHSNRLVKVVDEEGYVTETIYDLANRVTDVIRYYYKITASALPAIPLPADVAPPPVPSLDRRTRNFYDDDGLLVGTLDAEGFIVEYRYDAAGRLVETTRQATAAPAAYRESGTFLQLARANAAIGGVASASSTYDATTPVASIINNDRAGTGWANYTGGWTDATPNVYPDWVEVRLAGGTRTVDQVVIYSLQNNYTSPVEPTDTMTSIYAPIDFTVEGWNGTAWVTLGTVTGNNLVKRAIKFTPFATDRIRVTVTNGGQGRAYIAELEAFAQPADAATIRERVLHNTKGQVAATIDGEGALTEYVYDVDGNVASIIRYATKVTYAPGATLVSLRPASSAEDQVSTHSYDARNRVVSETNAEGTKTSYTYDKIGNLTSTTRSADTADRRTITARYDVQGRLTGELSGEGSSRITGNQTTAQVEAIWDAFGIEHTYDAASRRTSTTDANGHKTLFYYDRDGRLAFTVNALGEVEERRYNVLGQRSASVEYGSRINVAGLSGGIDSSALVTRLEARSAADKAKDSISAFLYNTTGTLKSQTDALGNDTTYTYDAWRGVTAKSEKIDATTRRDETYIYDRRGLRRYTTVTDPVAGTIQTQVEYDAFGRIKRSVAGTGAAQVFEYDRAGRQVQVTDPLSKTRFTTYDAFGRVFTQRDFGAPVGEETVYTYNRAERSLSVRSPEGIVVKTVRNRHGDTASVIDARGAITTYEYDFDGNLERIVAPQGITENTYDEANLLIETKDANGNIVRFEYDAANRQAKRTVVMSAGLDLVTTTSYDARGQRLDVTDPRNLVTRYEWDLKGQLKSQTIDPVSLALKTSYTYDGRGKTLTVTDAAGVVTKYTYDRIGRRIQEQVDPAGLNLTRKYDYDRNGNVVSMVEANGNTGGADPNLYRTRYVYDANGRLVYTVNALGEMAETVYDAGGRVVKQVDYAARISLSGLPVSCIVAHIQPRIVADAAADRTESRVYDRDGRLIYTLDGLGGVTKLVYDGNGNVVDRIAYAKAAPAGTAATKSALEAVTAGAGFTDAAHDKRVRTVYDEANRARYTIDGEGGVVERRHDGVGNVVELISYAGRISPSTAADELAVATALAGVRDPADDRREVFYYDRAGRLEYTFTVTGFSATTGKYTASVAQQVYDGNGNVEQRVRYANAFIGYTMPATRQDATDAALALSQPASDARETFSYDRADRLKEVLDTAGLRTETRRDANGNVTARIDWVGGVAVRTARTAYDTANRAVFAVDAAGAIVENTYDASGNLVTRRAYATAATAAQLTALGYNPTVAQVRAISVANAEDRVDTYVYDVADRLVYEVDAQRYVKRNTYDALGRVKETVEFVTPLSTFYAITKANLDSAYLYIALNLDRVNTFTYDAEGRLVESLDPGYPTRGIEKFTYDALGNKLTFTNKKNQVWTYDHDAAGRVIRETSPAVSITSLAEVFGVIVPSEITAAVVTELAYDALGRLSRRTEAAGLPNARTTTYEYDATGRQVKTIFPWVETFEGATEISSAVTYDALGNAAVNRDVGGGYSYKVYDAMGRVRYEVDAERYVTEYVRNAFGQAISTTRYSKPLAFTAAQHAEGSPITESRMTDLKAAYLGADGDKRILETSYDAMGRVSEVREPQVSYFEYPGLHFSAQRTTRTVYNAFGEATKVEVLRYGGASAATRFFHDTLGRKVAEVDALGYVTTFAYDVVGNLKERIEYVTRQASSWTPAVAIAKVLNPSGYGGYMDRHVQYTYDTLNRQTRETRIGVDLDGGTTNPITQYTYDALGNRTSTVDANGAASYTYYDALGRTIAVAAPRRTDTVDAAVLVPLTVFKLDAYGNAVQRTDYDRGTASANATTYTAPVVDPDDRSSFTFFDKQGHATRTVDAEGHSRYAQYNAGGDIAKDWESTGTATIVKTYAYDKLGRQTELGETIAGQPVRQGNRYNAFGEMTGRGAKAGTAAFQDADFHEVYEYDAAGRLWRTNAGDGVTRVTLFDQSGARTAEIRSATWELKYYSLDFIKYSIADADKTVTMYRNDLLGRVEEEFLPTATLASGAYWMPSSYDLFLQVEARWHDFFTGLYGSQMTWAAGTWTLLQQGHSASYRDMNGRETIFYYKEGPLGAVQRNEALRGGIAASNFPLGFSQWGGSYMPSDFGVYRQIEKDFNEFFTLYAPNTPIEWMGGILTRTNGNDAKFVDASGSTYWFYRSNGPLAVVRENAIIRAGWQRDYGTTFIGEGGEALLSLPLGTVTVVSGYEVRLGVDLRSLASWGAGDVKVEIVHASAIGNQTRAAIFSAAGAPNGPTIQWTGEPMSSAALQSVLAVRVFKKDINGDWIKLLEQDPNVTNTPAAFFTLPGPANPGVAVRVKAGAVGTVLTDVASPLFNFGERMLIAMPTPVNGKLAWEVHYNGTVHSSGVIEATVPELSTIFKTPSFDGDRMKWDEQPKSYTTATPTEAFNIRPTYYAPSDFTRFHAREKELDGFFDTLTTVGQEVVWARGKLYRGVGDTMIYVGIDQRAFTFTRGEGALSVAWRNQEIRDYWLATYGLAFTLDPDGYFAGPGKATQLLALDRDFDLYFASSTVGSVQARWSGVLTRTSADTATYRDAANATITINRTDGPLKAAKLNERLRTAWNNLFGVDLKVSAWTGLGISNHGASFADVGAGTYQYELLYIKGNQPYAHSVGFATVAGKTAAAQVGLPAIQLAFDTTRIPGHLLWTYQPVGSVQFRYKKQADTAWTTRAVGTTQVPAAGGGTATVYDVNLSGLAAATYDWEITYRDAANGPVTAMRSGTFVNTPAAVTPIVTDSQIALTVLTTPYADPLQFAIYDESGNVVGYTYPVVVSNESGVWTFGPGYGAPVVGTDENGLPIYGPAIALGVQSNTRIAWPAEADYYDIEFKLTRPDGGVEYKSVATVGGQYVVELGDLAAGTYTYAIKHSTYASYDPYEPPRLVRHAEGSLAVLNGSLGAIVTGSSLPSMSTPIKLTPSLPASIVNWWPPNTTVRATFQYRAIGATAWTSLAVDHGPNAFMVALTGVPNGNYEYQIFHTRANEDTPFEVAAGRFALATGGAGWVATPPIGIADLSNTYTHYFTHDSWPGQRVAGWAGGDLVRGTGDWTHFAGAGVQTFTNNVQANLNNERMRHDWEAEYGMTFTWNASTGLWVASNQAQYDNFVNDTNYYFSRPDVYPIGSTMPWHGGVLIRGDGYNAYWAPNGVYSFHKDWGPVVVAGDNAQIRSHWTWEFSQWNLQFSYQANTPLASIVRTAPTSSWTAVYGTADRVTRTASNTSIGIAQKIVVGNLSSGEFAVAGKPASYSSLVTTAGTTALSLPLGGAAAPLISGNSLYADPASVPKISRTYDRWGNVLTQSDARDATWVTTYQYDAWGHAISQTQPNVSVKSEAGVVTTIAPKTTYRYDRLGRLTSVIDANENASAISVKSATVMRYDEAGQLVEQFNADHDLATGTLSSKKFSYNAFGEKTRARDELGRDTTYGYDKVGRLKSTTHAATATFGWTLGSDNKPVETKTIASRVERYNYDEAGRRKESVNGAGETTRYEYDERGNVTKVVQALGQYTSYELDPLFGRKLREKHFDAAGNQLDVAMWSYDAFGRLQFGFDLDGRLSTYAYDRLGQLTRQIQGVESNPTQKLLYTYDRSGRLARIDDTVENSVTSYAYDKAGNKTLERFVKGAVAYQDNRISYDALGRVTEVMDDRHHMWVWYDAVGNRREVKTNFTDDAGTFQAVDNWYTYDKMGRVLKENVTNTLNISDKQGVIYTYDVAGNRKTATEWGPRYSTNGTGGAPIQTAIATNYQYDEENRLVKSTQGTAFSGSTYSGFDSYVFNGVTTLEQHTFNTTGVRRYDAAGRLSSEIVFHLNKQGTNAGADGGDDFADKVYHRYDANGKLKEQVAVDYQVGVAGKNGKRYKVDYAYDEVGNLTSYTMRYRPNDFVSPTSTDFTETYTYAYERAQGYREDYITLVRSGQGAAQGRSEFTYDANGYLRRVEQKSLDGSSYQTASEVVRKNRYFAADTSGAVLARVDGLTGVQNAALSMLTPESVRAIDPAARIRHSLVVEGQTLGISAMAAGEDPAIARFDFGAQTDGGPGDAPSYYIVTQADAAQGLTSLRGIAQAVYGDSSLWYVIAEANGIAKSGDLKVGMSLVLPNVASDKNDFRTFKPYSSSEIRGDNTPAVPMPQGGNNGCGVMGTVIIAIVAIVATIFTAGAASVLLAGGSLGAAGVTGVAAAGVGALAGTGGAIGFASAVIGGAVGSAVSQGVAIAAGMQDEFSWKGVAAGAFGAGFGAAAAPAISGALSGVPGLTGSALSAATAATTSALRQGLMVATGLQNKFSWAGVAASAVSAPLANEIFSGIVGAELQGPTLDGSPLREATFFNQALGSAGARFAAGFASGAATQMVMAAASGGRLDWRSIAADAFGNALGNAFVEHMSTSTAETRLRAHANALAFQADIAGRVSDNPILEYLEARSRLDGKDSRQVLASAGDTIGQATDATDPAARPFADYPDKQYRARKVGADDIDKYQLVWDQMDRLSKMKAIFRSEDGNHYVLGAFLDGTGNKRSGRGLADARPGIDSTNVGLLQWLSERQSERFESAYFEGVGTSRLTKIPGGALGLGLSRQVGDSYEWLAARATAIREENPAATFEFLAVGFSRGAVAARLLLQEIDQRGIPDLNSRQSWTDDSGVTQTKYLRNIVEPGKAGLNAVLFDTVSTGVADFQGLDVPFRAQVYHPIARDEMRDIFLSSPLARPGRAMSPTWFEPILPGDHSDLGNNHDRGGLGDLNLRLAHKFMSSVLGLPLGPIPEAYAVRYDDLWIHDLSRYRGAPPMNLLPFVRPLAPRYAPVREPEPFSGG